MVMVVDLLSDKEETNVRRENRERRWRSEEEKEAAMVLRERINRAGSVLYAFVGIESNIEVRD